ncbi:MAG: flavin reductase family protein [Planctomycetia bacterium]|nr:flavin reductase family protein [Planctomycetia bacterium]
MVFLDVASTPAMDIYQAMVGIVSPRPIAWVSTVDRSGRPNLAPFSFFNTFGSNPPVVVFSPTLRRDGTKKDTLLNLEEVPEFVIHAATWPQAHAVNDSSRELPRHESEADMLGMGLIPSSKVKPPRLKDAVVAMEGKVLQIIPIGQQAMSGNLVIGEIVGIHLDESILNSQGKVDPRLLQTIGRLGGDWFCKSTDLFELKRPT